MSLRNLQMELAELILADYPMQSNHLLSSHHTIIHRNTFYTHLHHALLAVYPCIARLVGAGFFQKIANEYIQHYPSRSGNLDEYGEYFCDFLYHCQSVHHLPYLSELATYEWICHTLRVAADHAPLDLDHLKKISPAFYEQLQISLHPACRLLQFRYPILEMINLCNGNIDSLDLDTYSNKGDFYYLVTRYNWEIVTETLTKGEYTFFYTLLNNASLSHATQAALIEDPLFNLEQKLPIWVNNHIIVDMK